MKLCATLSGKPHVLLYFRACHANQSQHPKICRTADLLRRWHLCCSLIPDHTLDRRWTHKQSQRQMNLQHKKSIRHARWELPNRFFALYLCDAKVYAIRERIHCKNTLQKKNVHCWSVVLCDFRRYRTILLSCERSNTRRWLMCHLMLRKWAMCRRPFSYSSDIYLRARKSVSYRKTDCLKCIKNINAREDFIRIHRIICKYFGAETKAFAVFCLYINEKSSVTHTFPLTFGSHVRRHETRTNIFLFSIYF